MKFFFRIAIYLIVFTLLFETTTLAHEELEERPSLSSEAAILIDSNSGQVLYEKYAESNMYPASLTKVATAIYAIEQGNLDDKVTVSEEASGVIGSSVYIEEGEQLTLEMLVEGLLVNSGNDAGVAIAEHLDGDMEQFSRNLNRYLKEEVDIKNTNFVNPHGLFDPDHVTTAADLAKITQYAIENETFASIFGIERLEWNGENWDATLYTHHKLMREMPYDGVTGGKTGYVSESGPTLITTAEREDIGLIAVVLKAPNQEALYQDTTKLLDYGFDHFQTTVIEKGSEYISDNGNDYRAEEDLVFTQIKDEQPEIELSNDGTLSVQQKVDDLNKSFLLEEVKEDKQQAQVTSEEGIEAPNSQTDRFPFTIVFSIIIGMVSLATVFIKFRKNFKNYNV
ncbi:D-alanyl-D-alanine carboxypeptidase family protein [Aquibacillus sediminis]|uniref:D-alanyl-D-alanine carboxypeptidase family protein n=1 Tax=Aquibacillus sediminis TaxID=2574734 RepID=UPI001FEB755B|nr:D-alanyl-D-alanine carboxypeptidase family protein [Aquibacillus sediminis]